MIGELSAELAHEYDFTDDGSGDFRPEEEPTARSVFLVGWLGDEPVACGAIRPLVDEVAEVKRMYVKNTYRGRGFSRAILVALEGAARDLAFTTLRLETGNRQSAAIRLYESAGFHRIEPFGIYVGSERSVCFEKQIAT